jgi:hypothetical protein
VNGPRGGPFRLETGRIGVPLMAAITPLHPGPVRFEGGLIEVGPGLHAWLQSNGLLG